MMLLPLMFLLSFAAFFASLPNDNERTDTLSKVLYALMWPLVLIELGMLVAGVVFVVWFAFEWGTSPGFG